MARKILEIFKDILIVLLALAIVVLTLLALYAGYRLLGVAGMILFPISAMLLKQIWDHSGLQRDV